MAIPLSNMVLPFKQTCFSDASNRPRKLFSTQKTIQPTLCLTPKSVRAPLLTPCVSKTDGPHIQQTGDVQDEYEQEEEDEQQQPSKPISDHWRQIHGQDDWVNMLDPIDTLLRSELIRYGEMAQACYDAFDYDPYSKNCGSCRFIRRNFFEGLEMNNFGYDVSRYLYATSNINLPNFFKKSMQSQVWSRNANWMGYVSVSNDEMSERLGRRDISIAWRGTVTHLEWIVDLMDYLRPVSSDQIPCPDPTVKVESGFLDLYTDKDRNCPFCKYSAREQILTEIRRIIHMYPNDELSITITGHSLGAALAILSAYDIVETGSNIMDNGKAIPVSVFSFSGPRVGNGNFKERFERLGVKVLRVVNIHDTVPKVPGVLFNENVPDIVKKMANGLPWCYAHVGVELALDHKKSPFLKETGDLSCFHNLEAHLHLLDGYHGRDQKFVLASGRDPALVNKASNFLKDHYLVPPFWRQDENKGMIRNYDGRWMQPERPKHDDHPHDIHYYLTLLGLASDK